MIQNAHEGRIRRELGNLSGPFRFCLGAESIDLYLRWDAHEGGRRVVQPRLVHHPPICSYYSVSNILLGVSPSALRQEKAIPGVTGANYCCYPFNRLGVHDP